jgi:hypothetical protein
VRRSRRCREVIADRVACEVDNARLGVWPDSAFEFVWHLHASLQGQRNMASNFFEGLTDPNEQKDADWSDPIPGRKDVKLSDVQYSRGANG